jgi:hypothetical protein
VGQGDPLSLLLFNIIVDCLTRMIVRGQQHNMVEGSIGHLIPKGIVVRQYADGIILCLKNDLVMARNVKLLLYLYEQMSGLKINFDKSEVILIGGDNRVASMYADIFNCQVRLFPIKYLEGPISPSRLHVIDCTRLEEKLDKKLDTWQGHSLSYGGRSVLIKASLSNTTIYHMLMFLLPKTTIEKMEKIRRRFFWQGGKLKKKYHLVRWDKVCKSKKKGVLGIKDLRKMNIGLLCKWWW